MYALINNWDDQRYSNVLVSVAVSVAMYEKSFSAARNVGDGGPWPNARLPRYCWRFYDSLGM